MKTGDLEPPWIVDISDAKAGGDLNDVVSWQFIGSLNGDVVFTDTNPVVVVDPGDATVAVATHAWVAGETDAPGTMRAEVIAIWPTARPQTFPGRSTAVLEIEPGLD